MSNDERAAKHAQLAEQKLRESEGGKKFGQPLWASQASAHAMLALYYQQQR